MSDVIVNFGSHIVPCSKLDENFYLGNIKLRDIIKLKTCFRDFNKYPIKKTEVKTHCEKILECVKKGTLRPNTLSFQASEFYFQAENVLLVNKLEVDYQKLVLLKVSEECESTQICVPFVLELYDKSKAYESIDSIINSKDLQLLNEKTTMFNALLSKSYLLTEFYTMLKNRYDYNIENQVVEILTYYLSQTDLTRETLYNYIDTLLDSETFKEYFSNCNHLNNPSITNLESLTNNVILFVFKFVAVSKENSKSNLEFITSQFMDEIFKEVDYPKSKVEIANIVKDICNNESAILKSLTNKNLYNSHQKIEFIEDSYRQNPDKFYNCVIDQTKSFEEISRHEKKLQKDLLEFSIEEIVELLKNFNSSITMVAKYKTLIRKYFEWGKNHRLIEPSKVMELNNLKKEKFVNSQNRNVCKFFLTENDYASAMERMYHHSNNLKVKQFIISFFFNSVGISQENIRTVTLFNYKDILEKGLALEIRGEVFEMKTILNSALRICEYFIEHDRNEDYRIKDTDFLICSHGVNNSTKNTHFPSVLVDLNQSHVIPYTISPKTITPSNLEQCVKFIAFEQYLIKNNLDVHSTNSDIRREISLTYKEFFNVKESVSNALVFSGYVNARFVNEFLDFKNSVD
jgi:hypothetical protein